MLDNRAVDPSLSTGSECAACAFAANVREAVALLDAIAVGGLFARPKAGDPAEATHATGTALIEVARKRLVDGLTYNRCLTAGTNPSSALADACYAKCC